jgi:hypothetical protein
MKVIGILAGTFIPVEEGGEPQRVGRTARPVRDRINEVAILLRGGR